LNEIEERLAALESRVGSLKDWKQKYEEDKRKWDMEKEELLRGVDAAQKLKEALLQFLPTAASGPGYLAPGGKVTKETLNLDHKELVVNLAHEEKELTMTTATKVGEVMFCALTELSKDGFSEAELSDVLKDHGWNVPHNTLAPTLGGLVRDGYLVKLEGTRPTKYRLPKKVKLNVRVEGG